MRQALVFASFVASSLAGFACTSGDAGGTGGTGGADGGEGGASTAPAILTFSRTLGFRHDSIADGVTLLAGIAQILPCRRVLSRAGGASAQPADGTMKQDSATKGSTGKSWASGGFSNRL